MLTEALSPPQVYSAAGKSESSSDSSLSPPQVFSAAGKSAL